MGRPPVSLTASGKKPKRKSPGSGDPRRLVSAAGGRVPLPNAAPVAAARRPPRPRPHLHEHPRERRRTTLVPDLVRRPSRFTGSMGPSGISRMARRASLTYALRAATAPRVLADGTSRERFLRAWRRDSDGWRAFVCYSTAPRYAVLAWVSAQQVRPA